MSGKVLVTTGALIGRPNGRDYRLLEGLAKQLKCDGFEFMMYSTWQDERSEIVDYLKATGLDFPTVHCQKGIGEDIAEGNLSEGLSRFDGDCLMAEQIGAKLVVLHLWNGRISDSHMGRTLLSVPELQKIAAAHGVTLAIENVVCNMESPLEHFDQLLSLYPDVSFTFDTKMSAFHGELYRMASDECERFWDGHIKHIHVNDYKGGYMDWDNLRTLPIGAGNIDFSRVFDHIHKTSYDGDYTIEATAFDQNGVVDTAMLNDCVGKLRKLIG